MNVLGVLIGIIVVPLAIALSVIVILAFVKIVGIRSEIAEVRMLLRRLCTDGQEKKTVPEPVPEPEHAQAPIVELAPAPAPEPVPVPMPAPEPEPVSAPEPVPAPVSVVEPAPEPKPVIEPEPIHYPEPENAIEGFWAKFEDWFCVRGVFAPKGTTREFAVATRWLTRVGAVVLVGAISYFLMLAIDKGWIGPVQRVYGMMAWGVFGTLFGVWLKQKSERYAILGELCAAVGLVALYLSFGLGHRYFKPPVITSGCIAFAGLFAATLAAGALSVRLKSLMIAALALVGGFLVPTICSFTDHEVQLHLYLAVLSVGAYGVACFRGWTVYALAAIVASALFSTLKCGTGASCNGTVLYLFHLLEFALFVAMTVRSAVYNGNAGRMLCWVATTLAAIFCLVTTSVIVGSHCTWQWAGVIHHLGWTVAFAALAVASRRRNWGGTPVLLVFFSVCAAFTIATVCFDCWNLNGATVSFMFWVFAALLAELGVRSRERTLQVLSLVCVVLLSGTAYAMFVFDCKAVGHGYAQWLVDRMQYLWSAPVLVAFVGWRLGASRSWMDGARKPMFAVAASLGFLILTVESRLFEREFLPMLYGGLVTVTWAVTASALLAAGIMRRRKVARLVGLGVLTLSVVKLLFVDTALLERPARVGVFALVGALLIAGALLYLKFKPLFVEAGAEARHPKGSGL